MTGVAYINTRKRVITIFEKSLAITPTTANINPIPLPNNISGIKAGKYNNALSVGNIPTLCLSVDGHNFQQSMILEHKNLREMLREEIKATLLIQSTTGKNSYLFYTCC